MQDTERALVSFFEQVALRDEACLAALKRDENFTLEAQRWRFTLPALHAFLQGYDDVFDNVDYRRFRQLIYSCPINRAVKALGSEVVIDDNRGKVDQSTYALVWRATG